MTSDQPKDHAGVDADLSRALLDQARAFETVRVLFVDQHGILRGKTIVADALESVCASGLGVPSTLLLKDTAHRTVFPVWDSGVHVDDLPFGGAGDLIMRPDPKQFFPVPWSPHSAILLCDLYHTSGARVDISPSAVLAKAVAALRATGYAATVGLEVEFQVFRVTSAALEHADATMPPSAVSTENLTQGYQYLTETRYSEVEDLLDHLRRMAQAMGLAPRSMEIEMGPSQFEFTFAPADPQTQAIRSVLFRTLVKEICQARGLQASFMAKPKLPNAAANGWHIHQSLTHLASGAQAFQPEEAGAVTPTASAWIAGLLSHAAESCLLTNPTVNSYKRFAPFQLAPTSIAWGHDNRGTMLRALLRPNASARIENRAPDPSANPFFAIAAQLLSGRAGLIQSLTAPEASQTPYSDGAARLPSTMGAALDAFDASAMYRESLGNGFVDYLSTLKRAEWDRYLATISDWEHQEYFGVF